MNPHEFSNLVDDAIERITVRLRDPKTIVTVARGEGTMDAVIAVLIARLDGQTMDAPLARIGLLLKRKNRAYGNSALDPVRIFSTANEIEGLRVRIDDKLSRLARGADAGEDTREDLLGYLVMLEIAERPADEVEPESVAESVAETWARVATESKPSTPWPELPPVEGMAPPKAAPAPVWALPFLDKPGWYARSGPTVAGPLESKDAALSLLECKLGWAAGDRHTFESYEVRA